MSILVNIQHFTPFWGQSSQLLVRVTLVVTLVEMIALPCALHGATKRETRGSPIFYLTFHYVFINRCDTTYIYIYSIPRIKICCISNQYTIILSIQHTSLYTLIYPLGSMYGIYAKIGDILMGSMLPYIAYMDIHGSYGYIYIHTTYMYHSYVSCMARCTKNPPNSLSQPDHSN